MTLPAAASGQSSYVSGTTIYTYIGSSATVGPITVTDSSGTAINLNGVYELVISKKYRGDILVIADGAITRSGASNNQFSFSVAGATTIPGEHCWALKLVSTNDPVAHGDFIVQQVANKD